MANGQNLAVVGGGITGLISAYESDKLGFKVTVFEETDQYGGKIKNGALDGKPINLGAEFIDAKNTRLIALCKELGVELIPATDQATEQFHLPDGRLISGEAFHKDYKPIAEQIIADKQCLIVDGKYTQLALHLNDISLTDYLQELAAKAQPPVDPQIIETVARVYGSEGGRNPEKINALQFVNEASDELGSFLSSDCGYRVAGGTHQLIDALRLYLQGRGVEFQAGAKVTKLGKEDGKFQLGFEVTPEKGVEKFDKVTLALPAYALGKIEGLEALGMKPEERELLNNTQYCHSSKFFVKLKDGVEVDNACFFSNDGFQAWISEKGMMTFLAGGENINKHKGIELINHCLGEYAKAHGKRVDELFEVAPDKMVLGAPDLKRPCYASPAMGQATKLGDLFGAMERMAQNGIAIAGTFLPLREGQCSSVGFMECGAASAQRAAQMLNSPLVEQKAEKPTENHIPNWVYKIFANGNTTASVGASYTI